MSLARSFYSKILYYTPPFLLLSLLRCISFIRYFCYSSEIKNLLKANAKLKNTAKQTTAYLLATGPSLKTENVKLLEGRDCFSVSNFFLHADLDVVNPKIHFFAPYHEPLIKTEYIEWLKKADNELPSNTAICLGHETYADVVLYDLFKNRVVHYLGLEKAQISNNVDLTKTVMKPQTSPLMVIPVLKYMGYKKIVLLGCDHNILKNYGDEVENFYTNDKDVRNNATSGNSWQAGIVKHLENALNVFKQYAFYIELFKRDDVEIINVSATSWLDFVTRMTLEEVLSSDCPNKFNDINK